MRRPAFPHLLLGGYCAGLCLALVWRAPLVPAAGAALVAVTLLFGVRRAAGTDGRAVAPILTGCLVVLFVCGGHLIGSARLQALSRSELRACVGQRVALTAVLVDLPAIKDDRVTLAVRVIRVGGREVGEPAHLRLRLAEGQTLPLDPVGPLTEGAVLRLSSVKVEPLPDPKPDRFDYGRYLRRKGEHVLLQAELSDLRIVGRRGGLQGGVDRLRLASRTHLATAVRSPVKEVLRGMVLGDDEGVDAGIEEDFRRSGLLHIMAVSGENVVLLCGMWSFLFALLGVHRLLRTALLLPVVATYVLLTGAAPSIVRAGVAGIVGLLAVLASRPSDGWLLWLAPAAWLLTANPNNLFDVSFQLSFGAVAGLLVLARPLTRAVSFLPGPLPEQVGVTTAASISTAPISMVTFGTASLVSVPANVAGGFVLGPIMFLGMLSLLLGFVSAWLSAPLNAAAGLFIGFLITVSHLFAGLPGAVYEYQGMTLRSALSAGFVVELAVVVGLAARSGGGLLAYVRDRRRRSALTVATAAMVAVALLAAPVAARPPDRPTLTFLDVGEGAAALLQVPDGPTVLVDTGPEPLARELKAHGVRDIDLLIVSHGHDDHVGGLADVAATLPIAVVLLPETREASVALDRIEADLRTRGADVRRCDAVVRAAGDGWGLTVLPSDPVGGTDENQRENDDALVVVVELGGHRILLPGDAEGPALDALALPACTVVGVPHHGSSGGFDAALLAGLDPRLAVIPVGPNRHGHPSAETLDLLADCRVPCLRTDRQGDVALSSGGDGLEVRTERQGAAAGAGPP